MAAVHWLNLTIFQSVSQIYPFISAWPCHGGSKGLSALTEPGQPAQNEARRHWADWGCSGQGAIGR